MRLGALIQKNIASVDKLVNEVLEAEKQSIPPAVQELVLSRRHLEDASFRLKKAYNSLNDSEK